MLLFNVLAPPQETALCAVLTAGHSLILLCHVEPEDLILNGYSTLPRISKMHKLSISHC